MYFSALADLLFPEWAESGIAKGNEINGGASNGDVAMSGGASNGDAAMSGGSSNGDVAMSGGASNGDAAMSGGTGAEGDSALSPEACEMKYPPRALPEGAAVTRLGPSPTGFIHLGNLFMAMVNRRLASQSGGVFLLRIEDTDQKREVEGAVPSLIQSLGYFGIEFDEGVGLSGSVVTERGDYGPYFQSERREIYRSFARKLVLEGKAYPCFLTEEEIAAVRVKQEAAKELPGIHGVYATWRDADFDLVSERIRAGEPYVVRLNAGADGTAADVTETEIATADITAAEVTAAKVTAAEVTAADITAEDVTVADITAADITVADGTAADVTETEIAAADGTAADAAEGEPAQADTITVTDGVRGNITMPKNIMDVVILKKDGLPTYHFAHVVDDHLMRTTHVIRGEEWLSSLPVHIALFKALGFAPPAYCHTALMMKLDGGAKRKLSKREDPEFALSYYIADGYHPLAIQEYLLTVINSNYEEWRMANPEAENAAFIVTMEKMGASGILFDLDKLQNVSRDTLARIPATELAAFMTDWARRERPDILPVLIENREVLTKALDIGRGGENPRKDLAYASQILDFISYFFDECFRMEDTLPDNVPVADARALLAGYLESYDHGDDRDRWFEKIRELSAAQGYAPKPKDFKSNPGMYKGHVGDVSTVIRLALTGRRNSPDIYEIQQILGEPRTRARIETMTDVRFPATS